VNLEKEVMEWYERHSAPSTFIREILYNIIRLAKKM